MKQQQNKLKQKYFEFKRFVKLLVTQNPASQQLLSEVKDALDNDDNDNDDDMSPITITTNTVSNSNPNDPNIHNMNPFQSLPPIPTTTNSVSNSNLNEPNMSMSTGSSNTSIQTPSFSSLG